MFELSLTEGHQHRIVDLVPLFVVCYEVRHEFFDDLSVDIVLFLEEVEPLAEQVVNYVGDELTKDTDILMEHQLDLFIFFCDFLPFVAHVDIPNVKD